MENVARKVVMSPTYGVESGDGDTSGEGMTLEQARRAAQREANRVRDTRYVVSTDPDEESFAVEPETDGDSDDEKRGDYMRDQAKDPEAQS